MENTKLVTFCESIRDYEGAPGDLNYQLNNPGDCRPSSVGYLAKYGNVQIVDTDTNPAYLFHKGKFAKFPTYELGWEYLLALVLGRANLHPEWTILDFFSVYSPSSDGNSTTAYAQNVATRCGVTICTTLGQLFSPN